MSVTLMPLSASSFLYDLISGTQSPPLPVSSMHLDTSSQREHTQPSSFSMTIMHANLTLLLSLLPLSSPLLSSQPEHCVV